MVRNRYLKRYYHSRISTVFGVFVTFNFIVLGIPMFDSKADTIVMLVKRLLNVF